MAEKSAGDFYRELDSFKLQMPGRHIVPFGDNDSLLKMLHCQYPNWETNGKVSSVPVARIPRLFLHNTQMSKKLQKGFKSLQTGEEGEIKIYRLLLEAAGPDQKGMMIFPNVNPREIFRSKSAHVEIDTVVAHPTKGFFVFNIKNQGGKGSSKQDLENDIKRHGNFIRMLIQYGQEKSVHSIPIHSVICWLDDDKKKKFDSVTNSEGRVLVFNKKELKEDEFTSSWSNSLEKLPDLNPDHKTDFDIAVARLVTLNSLESSAALIHDELETNYMQATNKPKGQFDDPRFDPEDKSLLETASKVKRRQGPNTFASKLDENAKDGNVKAEVEANREFKNEKMKKERWAGENNNDTKIESEKSHKENGT